MVVPCLKKCGDQNCVEKAANQNLLWNTRGIAFDTNKYREKKMNRESKRRCSAITICPRAFRCAELKFQSRPTSTQLCYWLI
jgi:hypothetical protein